MRNLLYDTLDCLSEGLAIVIADKGVYLKDDYFMDIYSGNEYTLVQELDDYINLKPFCLFLKRKNLFYRSDEQISDILSEAFIEAFLRNDAYPLKSYKGFKSSEGKVTPVKLPSFLKNSIQSKMYTIAKKLSETEKLEIKESSISTGENGDFGFEDFLALNGVESSTVVLQDSTELDEINQALYELSEKLYPSVSYACLLKDYEVSQDDFLSSLRYSMNLETADKEKTNLYEAVITIAKNLLSANSTFSGKFFTEATLSRVRAAS